MSSLSVTLIIAIATLLLRSACRFLEAKLQEMANIGLILAFNVRAAPRICPRSQISAKSVQK